MGLFLGLIFSRFYAKYQVQPEIKMRQDFNWSQLDRTNLYNMLYTAGTDIVGQKMPVKLLHQRLSAHIKSCLPVSIKKLQYDTKQDRGFPYMGGSYDSVLDRKGKKKFIEVVLSYNPLDIEARITKYRWTRLCSLFADTILHEMIHMRQFRARHFKSIPGYHSTAEFAEIAKEQEYYGDRDEMGAFAFNIACEMIDRFGYDPTTIKRYMDSDGAKRHKNSWWFNYMKFFGGDHNHKILRRMKLRIMRNLENAYYGKPFKTTNHLTY
jgi:hypothetical protein